MKKRTSKTGWGENRKTKEWPAVVYIWMMVLGIAGYLTGEIALSARPHPYHWLLLLIGVVMGNLVGWLWYRWRGDIH